MYLLFAGQRYYPAGGWGDFIGEFSSQEGALVVLEEYWRVAKGIYKYRCDDKSFDKDDMNYWWQIIDNDTKNVVETGGNSVILD